MRGGLEGRRLVYFLFFCLLFPLIYQQHHAEATAIPSTVRTGDLHREAYKLLMAGDNPGVIQVVAQALQLNVTGDGGEDEAWQRYEGRSPAVLEAYDRAAAGASGRGDIPSLNHMLGLALYAVGNVPKAAQHFARAILVEPKNLASWLNLGDCFLHTFQVRRAIWAFEQAVVVQRLTNDASKLFKARSWICDWTDRELMADMIRADIAQSLQRGQPPAARAADFTDTDACTLLQMSRLMGLPYEAKRHLQLRPRLQLPSTAVLRIGFISADFGVHPVVTLIRGMMASFDTSRVQVYCYSLTEKQSWWRSNISSTVHTFRQLTNVSTWDAANTIHSDGIHILIDLNGHTMGSGLPVLAHRPAALQGTFLGYVGTTGSAYVDFVIADATVAPPEMAKCLSEHLVYMPSSFFVNDYRALHAHVLSSTLPADRWARRLQPPRPAKPRSRPPGWLGATPAPLVAYTATRGFDVRHHIVGEAAPVLRGEDFVPPALRERSNPGFVFASFSNFQKIEPAVFDVWMAVLRRVPQSRLWLLQHHAAMEAMEELRLNALQRGIAPSRIVFSAQVPWLIHTEVKTVADLVLDTTLKNGHTSTADALWAGVPVITVRGDRMGNRVAASLLAAAQVPYTEAFSMREYEDLAVHLATHPRLLYAVRQQLAVARLRAPLFDTNLWTAQATARLRRAAEVCLAHPDSDDNRGSDEGLFRPRCRVMNIV